MIPHAGDVAVSPSSRPGPTLSSRSLSDGSAQWGLRGGRGSVEWAARTEHDRARQWTETQNMDKEGQEGAWWSEGVVLRVRRCD